MKEVGWLAAQARNMKHTVSPFVDKGRLRAFLKDPLLKELENYST
jgi:hypothetical protein